MITLHNCLYYSISTFTNSSVFPVLILKIHKNNSLTEIYLTHKPPPKIRWGLYFLYKPLLLAEIFGTKR